MRDADFALDLENDQFLIDNVVDYSSYDLLFEVNVLIDKSTFQNCLFDLKHERTHNEYGKAISCMIVKILHT